MLVSVQEVLHLLFPSPENQNSTGAFPSARNRAWSEKVYWGDITNRAMQSSLSWIWSFPTYKVGLVHLTLVGCLTKLLSSVWGDRFWIVFNYNSNIKTPIWSLHIVPLSTLFLFISFLHSLLSPFHIGSIYWLYFSSRISLPTLLIIVDASLCVLFHFSLINGTPPSFMSLYSLSSFYPIPCL